MSSTLSKTVQSVYQLSSVLVPLIIIYANPPGLNLFSWHPVLMSIGVTFLMAQATAIFNPGYSLFSSDSRAAKVTRHWQLQAAAIVALLVGFAAIYLNKIVLSYPHFTSWHGVLGLAAVVGSMGASCGGIATKFGVKFPPLVRPAHIKWVHSVAGTVVFSIGCVALLLGLASNWALNNMNRLERCSMGTMVTFLLVTVACLAKRKYLFKIL